MQEPFVSVIVPVYNAADFLRRCLESLIGQTYSNLEIICVNDGSTDGSAAILDEYAARDVRIKVIHQDNAGVSVARNRGLEAATGEYVTFVDADDWVEPDAYEKITSLCTAGVDYVWFGTSVENASDDAQKAQLEHCLRIPGEGIRKLRESDFLNSDGCVWNKVYRREFIEKYHCRFYNGIAYGEDAAFRNCLAAVADKVAFLPEKLYHYVQLPSAATKNEKKKQSHWQSPVEALNATIDFYQSHGVLKTKASYLFCTFHNAYLFAQNAPAEQQADALEKVYKLACRLGVLKQKNLWSVRDMISRRMRRCESLFHRFRGDCEQYGIGSFTLFSITYKEKEVVYRVLGREVCRTKMN